MRQFETIHVMNTIGQWVDAFNNNALAASDHTWYLGEMLYNGMLYTGLETIAGEKVTSLTNIPISHASPQNLELDNFYLYFRDINKVLLVDQVTFDIRAYNTGHPMYFYINSELGYRCSSEFKQEKNEVCLFRFILSPNEVFKQCYITAQRFGSNVYDTADEFFFVKGCVPIPFTDNEKLQLKLGDGTIKRSGIKFDIHQMPDLLEIEDKPKPFKLRYVEKDNTIDYNKDLLDTIIPTQKLDYKTNNATKVTSGKFTIQRILYDPYEDCLIMQYGDTEYNDMQHALTAINNVSFPFPYNTLMFIPMGIVIIKEGCTDMTDVEQCMLIQQLNTTINPQDSVFFAEDSYARGRLDVLKNDIDDLQRQIDDANTRMDGMDTRMDNMDIRMNGMDTRMNGIDTSIKETNDRIDNTNDDLTDHIADKNDPHNVTKSQVGLGNVENKSVATIQSELLDSGKFVKTSGNQDVGGVKKFTDGMETKYIRVGGRRLYLGGSAPDDAVWGDFWLPDV